MYAHGKGAMFDWLREQRDMSDCGQGSPVQYLHRQGLLGENLLAIHVNYLAPGDAELLAQSKTSVVHCPRSFAYFGHDHFPHRALNAAGVNVCLGTDSLATVRASSRQRLRLDMFAEMRALARREPGLRPEAVVAMATVHGARALGRAGELGVLAKGASADLITIPSRVKAGAAYEAVLDQVAPVGGVMIGGRWVFRTS